MKILLTLFVSTVLLMGARPVSASDWYVSPTGTQTGAGTEASPWDLQTALIGGPTRLSVKPGDTIWLMDGRYGRPIKRPAFNHAVVNDYRSFIAGTATAPIIIRQARNARAIIDIPSPVDSSIMVLGDYTWWWGFEVMSSDPLRVTSQGGSFPDAIRRGSPIASRKNGVKFINLITHDMRGGPGHGFEGRDNEIYGLITYYNGWEGGERSHGHGIYTQNRQTVQPIENNMVFQNMSHGIHVFGSDQAALDNIHLLNNTSFKNAQMSIRGPGDGREILFGGNTPMGNPVARGNVVYGSQFNYGYGAGCTNGSMTGNWSHAVLRLTPL